MSRTLSRLKRECGISLETLQRKRASSRIVRRISWFFSSCRRTLGVPLKLRWGPQGPAHVALGQSSLHACYQETLGISLQSVLDPRSGDEDRTSGFHSSADMDLSVPMELQRGPKGPARVASGKSSLHASCEGPLRIPFQLVPGPRSSSGAQSGSSGFLSSADMAFGVPMEFPQESQASSRVETCKSAFLLNCNSSAGLPVELI